MFYKLRIFAIDIYSNVFVAYFFLEMDFDVNIGSFAVFEAEFRIPVEKRAQHVRQPTERKTIIYTLTRFFILRHTCVHCRTAGPYFRLSLY